MPGHAAGHILQQNAGGPSREFVRPVLSAGRIGKANRMSQATCRARHWKAAAAAVLLVGLGDQAVAQSPAAQRGLTFVLANCASCHSTDKVTDSRLALAPPFRTLHLKYPV